MGLADEVVLPRYEAAALTDVLPSVRAALGDQKAPNLLGLPKARGYVVVLIDALGWHLLHRHRIEAPFLGSLLDAGRPLTSGVPSTTSTSLVGLGTGLAPGQHGVVGYTFGIPGGEPRLLNTLHWDAAIPPQEWQPHPTMLEQAAAAGVEVTSIGRKSFRGTGLTTAGLRGGTYLAADSAGQRVDRAVHASKGPDPSLVYLYDGDLDWTGHRDGCDSPAFRYQLGAVDSCLTRLRRALPAETVLLVTGDHGMVDVPYDARIDVDSDPDLRAGVYLVAGDPRLRYLYTLPGQAEKVARRWRERLGDQALVRTREETIAAGWYGEVDDRVRPCIGDVVLASLGPISVQCASAFPAEADLLGWHGSLTPEEMLVPLLLAT